jgi:hypothetical protein
MVDLTKIFGEFGFEAKPIDSGKEPEIYGVPTVHRTDQEAVCVIEPDYEQGPWIAGGACLKWFQGLPVGDSDIDVFCKNAVQAQQIIERIKSYGRFHVKFESENAVTLTYHRKDQWVTDWTIQVITRRYFSSLREVIDSFDLSVCAIGTTGTEWEMGKTTARDIREKNLRFIIPLQPDAPKRLVKYWTYGYRPVPGTLESIQNNPTTRWTYEGIEDYNNAF